MAILLLANIGNSDLSLSGNMLEKGKQREESKLILDDFESMHTELTLPILTPIVDEIYGIHKHKIDHVILFSTDQPISVAERFHANDTLYTAQVIKRLLQEDERFSGKIKTVDTAPPITFAPNDLDSMMRWFAENLQTCIPKGDLSDIYVSVTGGTPAMNQALFFHTLYSTKSNARKQLIYTSESGGVRLPGALTDIDKEFQLARIRNFLTHFDYSAVLEILRARGYKENRVTDMLSACDLRLNFRLEEAQNLVGPLRKKSSGEESRYFIQFDEQIKLLLKGIRDLKSFHKTGVLTEGIKAIFVELYHNMRLLYDAGRYVDMMSRLFRLQEGMLRLLCEQKFRVPARKSNQFVDDMESSLPREFRDFLESKTIWISATRKFYKAVIDFYSDEFNSFKKWNDRVNPLVEERNLMIIGHEFEGASEKLIKEKCQGSDLIQVTETMLRKVLDIPEIDFDLVQVNSFLLKKIRQGLD